MAQRTVVNLIDDLDGVSEAAETVSFSLDGKAYEIDLTAANAAALRKALAEYVQAARRSGRVSARRGATPAAGGPSPEEIRKWAKSKKLKVSERGRISAELRKAYDEAH